MSDSGRVRSVVVEERDEGSRADVVVASACGVSVREARALFADGGVTRVGRRVAKGDRLRPGDVLEVVEPGAWLVPKADERLVVVYEDADVVVVDKPAGVPSHPLARGEGGTVVDALCARFPECALASDDEREGGLVHRLDTDTSGLLAAARSREVWQELRQAFTEGRVGRAYLALVEGRLAGDLVVDALVAHDPSDPRRMVTVGDDDARSRGEPKTARSRVSAVASGSDASLVVVRATGGRRHQVRVHLASAGHPLVGDALYGGGPTTARQGHLLHAVSLELPGRPALRVPPPADFLAAVTERGLDSGDVERAMGKLDAP